jgi:ferrous iron transport protein B
MSSTNPTATPSGAPPGPALATGPLTVALLGNPNTGKTTLFNRLCGIRAKTANFPGSTVEARRGQAHLGSRELDVIDLPGLYSLYLRVPESTLGRDCLAGEVPGQPAPERVIVVIDATNLARNLHLLLEIFRTRLPVVVALNMTDLAQRRGLTIDTARMSERLGCPVVPICARAGTGLDELGDAIGHATTTTASLPRAGDRRARTEWIDELLAESVGGTDAVSAEASLVDRLDVAFTHPLVGLFVFAAVMIGLFYTIFTLATVPMDLIDILFANLGGAVDALFTWADGAFGWSMTDGAIHALLVDGIIGGVAGTVVFLPQICLLFFLISVLEDTGYLARAAFVMDRLLRPFGLPGQAFVPLLSAHACAIPSIMATRLIPDHRDRLATILVAPFLSCSARLPVYVLLVGLLFAERPLLAGVAFTGCYALGAVAALLTSLLLRRTLLRGSSRPMVLELPDYKMPSIRSALLTTWDRGIVFLKNAGTVIVCMCIVLWWLSAYPTVDPPAEAVSLQAEAEVMAGTDPDRATELEAEAERITARHASRHSFTGRLGRAVEPVFAPLGYDWQLTIGVLSSFAAREVFVSTMAIVVAGTDADPGEDPDLLQRIGSAPRDDTSPLFTTATSASLLVFYVLAMQCLPTLAVTRRETGGWRWALFQLGYMTVVAWLAAWITYTIVRMAGG